MLILPGEVIGLIDFGTVGFLDERDKANLIRLYIAIIQFDAPSAVNQLIRMGIADPTVDEIGLERDLRRLLRRYKGLPLKDISASELLAEIQPIIYEYRLRVPSDYWLLIKTLVVMEGVGKQVAPDFDVFEVSGPYVRRFLIQLALPTSWGPVSYTHLDVYKRQVLIHAQISILSIRISPGDAKNRMPLRNQIPYQRVMR